MWPRAFAGGRLATELRDTPVSYSIITREFIETLNLVDLQAAADWTTGGTLAYDIETPMAFGQYVNYSTRGSSPGVQQRNFFPQRNNLDEHGGVCGPVYPVRLPGAPPPSVAIRIAAEGGGAPTVDLPTGVFSPRFRVRVGIRLACSRNSNGFSLR